VRAYAGVPLYATDGTVVGLVAVGDRRPGQFSAEQLAALRDFGRIASGLVFSRRESELRRLMSRAIEEALDFVLLTDASLPADGGPFIEYSNASLLHALGFTADEVIGKPYSMLLAPTNDRATLDSIAENMERARDNEKEIQIRRKDGSTFWVEFTGRPLLDENGTPSHWIAVGRDITQNRATLSQTAALLKALDCVGDHVEIHTLQNGSYELVFQNSSANVSVSALIETMLADASVRARLQSGEIVTLGDKGVALRPLGQNADTVICVRRQARRFADASSVA
jgi:PAS domain S-box-containing protein